jgi:hypothetical protein
MQVVAPPGAWRMIERSKEYPKDLMIREPNAVTPVGTSFKVSIWVLLTYESTSKFNPPPLHTLIAAPLQP